DHIMFRKVHIVDLKTNKSTNLENPGKLGQVAWSPDGKKLAIITGKDKHDPMQGLLWIHTQGKSGWHDTSRGPGFVGDVFESIESIAWRSPHEIAFQSADGVIGLNFAKKTKSGPAFFVEGTHRPILGNITVSRDGKKDAFIGHRWDHAPEVYA